MIKEALDVIMEIVPPADADPNHLRRYRIATFVYQLILGVVIVTHIALACGFVVFLFPGFARADSIQPVSSQLVYLQTTILDSEIYQIREKQCKTPEGQKDELTRRMYALMDVYFQTTGRQYRLPGCEEF